MVAAKLLATMRTDGPVRCAPGRGFLGMPSQVTDSDNKMLPIYWLARVLDAYGR